MSLKERVEKTLSQHLAPLLSADESGIELVEVDEKAGAVVLRITGSLATCPGASFVKADVIERALGKDVRVRYVSGSPNP